MPKFRVVCTETNLVTYEIDASDKQDAEDRARSDGTETDCECIDLRYDPPMLVEDKE